MNSKRLDAIHQKTKISRRSLQRTSTCFLSHSKTKKRHSNATLNDSKLSALARFYWKKNNIALVLTWVTSTFSVSLYISSSLSLFFISSFHSSLSLPVSLGILLFFLSFLYYVPITFSVSMCIFVLLSVGNLKITDNNNNITQQFYSSS